MHRRRVRVCCHERHASGLRALSHGETQGIGDRREGEAHLPYSFRSLSRAGVPESQCRKDGRFVDFPRKCQQIPQRAADVSPARTKKPLSGSPGAEPPMTVRTPLTVLAALISLACTEESARQRVMPSSDPSTVPPPVQSAPPAPRPAPADLSVEALSRELGCGKTSVSEPCRILGEFATASRWTPRLPSGEGRWVGNATIVDKGKEKREILILFAKNVPTSHVSPGDLALKVGYDTIAEDLRDHAGKMIRSLARGDTPNRRNQARATIESFVPQVMRGAVNTALASVQLISEEQVFLRQAGRKVLVVMPNRQVSAVAGDGTYAELWVATW